MEARAGKLRGLVRTRTSYAAQAACETVLAWMREDGLDEVVRQNFPADGTTVFADRVMASAWSASAAKIELSVPGMPKPFTLAEFAHNSYCLVRGSTSTPAGGKSFRLMNEAAFLGGEDARDALVALEPETRPDATVLEAILDRGGLGYVSDFSPDPFATPDRVPVLEGGAERRPYVCFALSPRLGMRFRTLAAAGNVTGRAFSDGMRFLGTSSLVTGVVPGATPRELWLTVLLDGPDGVDGACGAALALAAAQAVRTAGVPRFTVRVIVAENADALTAYAAYRGAESMRAQVVGGCLFSAAPEGAPLDVLTSGAIRPFYGDLLAERLRDGVNGIDRPSLAVRVIAPHTPAARGWPSPPVADVPTLCVRAPLSETVRTCLVTWVSALANHPSVTGRSAARQALEALPALVVAKTPWWRYAARIVPARCTGWLPQDLVRLPRPAYAPPPDPEIVSLARDAFVAADGVKTLARLLRDAECARGIHLDERTLRHTVLLVCRLCDAGYGNLVHQAYLTKESVVRSLRAAGVREGDLLLVHSSLSACGYIRGGAAAVLAALRAAVGEKGTVLLPAFSHSYRLYTIANRLWSYRPYDAADLKSVRWIGEVPCAFLTAHPDAPRSAHVTNAWTGFGPQAAACLADHPGNDAPASVRSPLAKALAAGGKAVFIGADLDSCTFLHYLEDKLDLPGLGPALVGVRRPDGGTRDVFIARHVPGPRAFYRDREDARFFREAKKAGLAIAHAPLGLGQVKAMSLAELDRIGTEICRREPSILLG